MDDATLTHLRVEGSRVLDHQGRPVRLRGACIGGWLHMENFITGYSANESMMRAEVRRALGDDRYDLFFDRLRASFYTDADAAFLGRNGMNCVRVPVHYRNFEDDARPFVLKQDGFRHLDEAISMSAAHGVTTLIDLHAVPGAQNHHWHSDNPTHRAQFWEHPHFQDRVVHLWEALADRYSDEIWVAGYNLMNEPADETREVVGPFYRRLVDAVRQVDPHHMLFLDGNTYSTEFDVFDEPFDNTVYTCHDYVPAAIGRSGGYDRGAAQQKFLQRSEYSRRTGTPIYVGEFGSQYTGDPDRDEQRLQILHDQLETYREHDAGWALWLYKDIGLQGLVYADPESAYRRRFGDFVAKKKRLGVDRWGGDGEGPKEVTRPVQELVAREFPRFDPYPWGGADWVRNLLLGITFAQPMTVEYADLFRGLDDSELLALADSFAFASCAVREPLRAELENG